MTLLVFFLMFVGHFMILKENLVQCVVLHGFLFCESYLHAQIHTAYNFQTNVW
jgi:multisubunit Na+/H+ antiporter MnhC subunit